MECARVEPGHIGEDDERIVERPSVEWHGAIGKAPGGHAQQMAGGGEYVDPLSSRGARPPSALPE